MALENGDKTQTASKLIRARRKNTVLLAFIFSPVCFSTARFDNHDYTTRVIALQPPNFRSKRRFDKHSGAWKGRVSLRQTAACL